MVGKMVFGKRTLTGLLMVNRPTLIRSADVVGPGVAFLAIPEVVQLDNP